MTYQEIIKTLAKKYNIGEMACERIIDSQFKVVVENIQSREIKTINLIKLGKFTPIQSRLNYVKRIEEKSNTNITDNRGNSQEIIENTSN